MRVLVTGSNGFVGRNLVERLEDNGNEVIGIDISEPRYEWEGWDYERVDLSRYKQTMELADDIEDVDCVIHLAGNTMPRVSENDWDAEIDVNVKGTIHALELAGELRASKFIFASSDAVYGKNEGVCSEETEYKPLSIYGISKMTCEHEVRLYCEREEIDYVNMRFGNIVGPWDYQNVVTHILEDEVFEMHGYGELVRDFTDVRDVLDFIEEVLEVERVSDVYNVSRGEGISVEDLYEEFDIDSEVRKVEKPEGERDEVILDNSKAKSDFNWRPRKDLEDMVRNILEWRR